MDETLYLEKRVKEQIDFYERKSKLNKFFYYGIHLSEICVSASIPVIAGYFLEKTWSGIVLAILGLIITVFTSVDGLFKFHEKWIQYRITAEKIKKERELFLTKSANYLENENTTTFNVFVENIEEIISSENKNWKQFQKESKEHK